MSADEAIEVFIPATIACGKPRTSIQRTGLWFDRTRPSLESVHSIVFSTANFGAMVLLVSNSPQENCVLYSAYPYAPAGAKQRLRIREIRDWGNEVEAVLVCENEKGIEIAFFDTHYFAYRDRYRVGESYDFRIAGLIYTARCTNDETIQITSQDTLAKRAAVSGEEPERLPDGTLAPLTVHYAGCTGYAGRSADYPEDAEFYCVVGKVTEFSLEGTRMVQIIPKSGDRSVPLPGRIYAAASRFSHGYLPKPGDSIGGGLWTQGFLSETKMPKLRK